MSQPSQTTRARADSIASTADIVDLEGQDLGPCTTQEVVAVPREVVAQIGSMARHLHDTLQELGVMPQLKVAADGIPDARSRLLFIAGKTSDAANRVLNAVDLAKEDRSRGDAHAQAALDRIESSTQAGIEPCERQKIAEALRATLHHSASVDERLTEIMLAQDFHDLTGQVITKVVHLANELESSLVKLLVQVVPDDQRQRREGNELFGPMVDPKGRTDVVSCQSEVDDLLSSLGF